MRYRGWPRVGRLACLLFLLALSARPVLAEVSVYRDQPRFWVAVSAAQTTLDFGRLDASPLTLGLRVGGMMDDTFGTELRLARGIVADRDERVAGTASARRDDSLDHLASVLVLARLPLAEGVYARAVAGLSDAQIRTRLRRCNGGACRSDTERNDDTSLSWGLGGYWQPQPSLALSVEFMRYLDRDTVTLDAVELAAVFLF
ncbi:hypothetical protein A167_00358 [Alcanivorax sp. S71-1-4]|uniref:outer membrane beta-barrel protein n=1 Tax=Alcanivorax sp. S71-1-4 TaxID=1177159 RepID=UPI00135C77C1|nr:outer membrane beta-barrel protein [Alcanivorax sp. S71-1-4]KAF0810871.1 hypothetical protein A167_00358 [Alcanivorax sp. S71-1-4]